MSPFEYREAYLADAAARIALIQLIEIAFGSFDIARFEQLGYWDPRCRPFSYFHGQRCIANVSVFDFPLIVAGRAVAAGGVQSVATHPEYRGRRLFRDLMDRAIAYSDAKFESLLLFTSIPSLYERWGFRAVSDDIFDAAPLRPGGARAMQTCDPDNTADIAILDRLVRDRIPASDTLGFVSHWSMFFYNELRHRLQRVRLLREIDAAIVFECDGRTLRLLDVVAARMPALGDIAAYLPPHERLEVWFTPDKLGMRTDPRPRAFDDVLMVRGPWPIEREPYGFPPTGYF